MASYLQIENISKSYGPKVLFDHICFNINEGDKMALIAPNGTGKTSLLRILAGEDKSDSGGKIMFLKDIRIAFLQQEYDFDPEKGIFEQIMSHSTAFTDHLDQEHLWEYERRVRQYITSFRLPDPDQKMKELSGGEVNDQPPRHRRHRIPRRLPFPLPMHPADGDPRQIFPRQGLQHGHGAGPRGTLCVQGQLSELP